MSSTIGEKLATNSTFTASPDPDVAQRLDPTASLREVRARSMLETGGVPTVRTSHRLPAVRSSALQDRGRPACRQDGEVWGRAQVVDTEPRRQPGLASAAGPPVFGVHQYSVRDGIASSRVIPTCQPDLCGPAPVGAGTSRRPAADGHGRQVEKRAKPQHGLGRTVGVVVDGAEHPSLHFWIDPRRNGDSCGRHRTPRRQLCRPRMR
jgi:hypothetical protein